MGCTKFVNPDFAQVTPVWTLSRWSQELLKERFLFQSNFISVLFEVRQALGWNNGSSASLGKLFRKIFDYLVDLCPAFLHKILEMAPSRITMGQRS